MPERAAAVEFRVSGRTLVGEAIRYNQQARDRAELFESGAFQPIGDVTLNLQHDPERVIADTRAGTLRIDDSPDALRLEADLRENSGGTGARETPRSAWPERRVPLPVRTARRRPAGSREGRPSRYRAGRLR